jgi:hypothetical protein
MRQKTANIFIVAIILTITIFTTSCRTLQSDAELFASMIDRQNPYPNMEILRFENSQAYFFANPNSQKLLIIMEGSGWDSALGIVEDDVWVLLGLAQI